MSIVNIPQRIDAECARSVSEISEKTTWQKLRYICSHITVEPLLLFVILPSVMNSLTTQNLYLEKACRINIRYNASVCDAMARRDRTGYDEFQEEEVQKLVSKMFGIKMTVIGSYPVFLMLFLGSWSDRHGRRKPLILMPVIGELLTSISLFMCSYYFEEISIEYTMLLDTIPIALGGTWACGFLGIYTYVSGLCSDKDRTVRIGAVTMCQNISGTLGIFLSGIMINLLGFKGVYTLSTSLISIALAYGVFVIKEQNIVEKKKTTSLSDFFSVKYVKETFRICFKKGNNNRRGRIIAIMLLSMMIMGPFYGELSVVYLYTRIKCGWNEIDFSFYNSLHSVVQIFGSLFALAFFTRKLKLDDAFLGVISMTSKFSACFVFAFATTGLHFYLGGLVELFHGTCHIALRSLMAKIVPPHELGQSNSIFGVFEAITPLIFGPVYISTYNYSIAIFPGAFFLVSAGFYVITFLLFFWIYTINKRSEEVAELDKQKEADQIDKLLKS